MQSTRVSFWHNGIHTFTKIIICLCLSIFAGQLAGIFQLDKLSIFVISWDVFAFSLLSFYWVSFYTTPTAHIRRMAEKEDGNRAVIFTIILIAIFCSMLAVVLLLTTKNESRAVKIVHLLAAGAAMLLSWSMLHSIFTIKYAHWYYAKENAGKKILNFPGDQLPDFLDFAYFSYGLGMTFQVSDVSINDKKTRRLALWHSLISFGYNAVIIAITINILAGLGS